MDATYKGATLTTKGIIIESFEWFKKPRKRNTPKEIPGRNGALVTEYGYEPLSIPMIIGLKDMTKLDEILALLDGTGVLTCSADSGKYRTARVLEQIDYEKLARFKKASVEFYIEDPFRYVIGESDQTVAAFPATIVNAGTVEALPLLKITGSGTVTITLNGVSFTYIFDTSYVYLDCLTKKAYYGTSLKTRNMTGNAPTLAVGNNILSITGTVTEIVVTKRTRYL